MPLDAWAHESGWRCSVSARRAVESPPISSTQGSPCVATTRSGDRGSRRRSLRRPCRGRLRERHRPRPHDRVGGGRGRGSCCWPALRADMIYADLNTASPAQKHEVAALVAGTGARFADVALLGPVPASGLATPALASGPGAQALASSARTARYAGRRSCPTAPGDAAVLKLLRSVFMKGLAASVLESTARPRRRSVGAAWLEGEIAAVIGKPLLERLVEGSHLHARRRADEMESGVRAPAGAWVSSPASPPRALRSSPTSRPSRPGDGR